MAMAKDYDARARLKNYEAGVIKERLMSLASELEEMGFKRDSNTLNRIASEIEEWQHK